MITLDTQSKTALVAFEQETIALISVFCDNFLALSALRKSSCIRLFLHYVILLYRLATIRFSHTLLDNLALYFFVHLKKFSNLLCVRYEAGRIRGQRMDIWTVADS